jgi:hypothetical protein
VTNGQTNTHAASNNSDNMDASLTWPGTLLHLATDNTAEDTATAKHIVHWTDILHQGGDAFGNAVVRNGRRLTQQPLVFAAVLGQGRTIDVTHGFDTITMDDETHDADGLVGFFLGYRIVLHNDDNTITYQDPQYWAEYDYTTLATKFVGPAASVTDCKTAAERATDKGTARRLLLHGTKATGVDVPKLFPLPKAWWPFFLSGKRSPLATFQWLRAATKGWTTKEGKIAAQRALCWARAACTNDPIDSDHSCLALDPSPVFMDQHVARWATHTT